MSPYVHGYFLFLGGLRMNLNEYIDHTNLKQTSTYDDIKKLCCEAKKYNFKSVCVNTYYVKYARGLLKDSNVKVCTVIGFPNGYSCLETKVFEANNAIENGADEIDMVININALKNKDYNYVKKEISMIREIAINNILKVIIETCFLDEDEIKKMTEICNETSVDFIKTSTGFGSRGVSLEDLDIINKYKNEALQIKASGGIKNKEYTLKLIEKGATRIGTSSGISIMEGE